MPERIQRKRTKGWKAPEGTVYVGRGCGMEDRDGDKCWSDYPAPPEYGPLSSKDRGQS